MPCYRRAVCETPGSSYKTTRHVFKHLFPVGRQYVDTTELRLSAFRTQESINPLVKNKSGLTTFAIAIEHLGQPQKTLTPAAADMKQSGCIYDDRPPVLKV